MSDREITRSVRAGDADAALLRLIAFRGLEKQPARPVPTREEADQRAWRFAMKVRRLLRGT